MRLVFDIEANGLLTRTSDTPPVDRIHCIVAKDLDTNRVYQFRPHEIEDGCRLLMQADLLVGHNVIGYDLPALTKVYPWFAVDRLKVVDTLVLSRLHYPNMLDHDFNKAHLVEPSERGKHRLKSWGQRLGLKKMNYEGGWSEFSEEMLAYCVGDIETGEVTYRHLIDLPIDPRASALEHACEYITTGSHIYGFPFDVAKAEALCAKLQKRLYELEEVLKLTFKPWYEVDGEVKRSAYESEEKGWWGYRINHRQDLEVADPSKDNPWTNETALSYPRYKSGVNKGQLKRSKEKSDYVGYKYQNVKLIEFNPNSRQHIIKRLKHLYNWKHDPNEVTPSGQPKIDDTILGRLPYPEAKLMAEYLMLQKRLGLLKGNDEEKGWLNVYDTSSGIARVHGSIITNGAVTGRGTHRIIANIPRVTTPYGPELRELFTASPGRVQVGIDVSGLELRMLAHFLAKWDNGAYGKIVCDGDVHTANKEAAGLDTRDKAKTFIYAFLYGGGNPKLGSIANPLAKEQEQGKIGKKLRASFINSVAGLEKLTDGLKEAAKRGYLIGLDGRKVILRSDHSALNFLLQSGGALVCKRWMCLVDEEIRKRGWEKHVQLLIFYHDELAFDVAPHLADDFAKVAVDCIRKSGDYFNIRVPLTGEAKIGSNWRNTH